MPIRPKSPSTSVRPSRGQRRFLPLTYLILPAAAIVSVVAALVLWRSGLWLVRTDSFEKVKWAVVLAGESRDMERTEAAALLMREGQVDSLIISGNRIFGNRYTSEFAARVFLEQGVEPIRVFEFRNDAYSTVEEAVELIRQFRFMGLDTVLVITSNFHTHRAGSIFQRLAGGDPEILVHAADYPLFDPGAWWSSRESRKHWLTEWLKVVHGTMEATGKRKVEGQSDFNQLLPVSAAAPGTGIAIRGKQESLPGPSKPVSDGETLPNPTDSGMNSESP